MVARASDAENAFKVRLSLRTAPGGKAYAWDTSEEYLFKVMVAFSMRRVPNREATDLSRVDERLLVLQPGIRAVPLQWESQLQDTGPQETFQLHVIPNGENLPEISISTP